MKHLRPMIIILGLKKSLRPPLSLKIILKIVQFQASHFYLSNLKQPHIPTKTGTKVSETVQKITL